MTKIYYPKTNYYMVTSKKNNHNLLINAENIYHAISLALSYPIFINHSTIDFKVKRS